MYIIITIIFVTFCSSFGINFGVCVCVIFYLLLPSLH